MSAPHYGLGDACYRQLLRALPADVRRDVGEDMVQLFRDERRELSGRPLRLAFLWCVAVIDVAVVGLADQSAGWRHRLRRVPRVQGLTADVRWAVRALRSTPVASAVAVLSLALGIGANTAMFSLVNSVLLRALPVRDPARLAIVSTIGDTGSAWTYAIWDAIRQRAQSFDDSCAWMSDRFNVAQRGEAQPVDGLYVSGDYFATLGVPALVGRTLTPADDVEGGARSGPAAVISYGFWQRRFGGAASVIGAPLMIEHVPFTIVGVTSPAFFGAEVGRTFDVALPMHAEPLIRGKDTHIGPESGFYGLTVLLRLRAGQSIDAATTFLRGVEPEIRAQAMPSTWPPIAQREFMKAPLTLVPAALGTSGLREVYERPLAVIFVVVAIVLCIASANIANLQLARTSARRHELGVQRALGASQWRLIRQSFLESFLLSGAGAALGLIVARWGSRILVAQLSSGSTHVYLDLALDWRVLAFTTAVAAGTALLVGTVPAFRATRVAPIVALRALTRGTSGSAPGSMPNGLLVTQVALSLVLVVAAGLFLRTFRNLAIEPLGFDRDRVLLVNVNVARASVEAGERTRFFDRIAGEIAAVPGVAHAAGSLLTPIGGNGIIEVIRPPGEPPSFNVLAAGKLADHSAFANFVTPGWFAAYGTPLKSGRDFDARDTKTAAPVVVVNEAFVRKFLPAGPTIGAPVEFERGRGAPLEKTVIGVVGDSTYESIRDDASPTVYEALAQFDFGVGAAPPPAITFSVRTSAGAPTAVARGVSASLLAIDPNLVFAFRPLADQIDSSLTQERLVAMLSGFFGILALLLAGLGLYGVTSYAVSRRRIELGIRMALGATPSSVVRLVLARVVTLVGLGTLAGAAVSIWASRFVGTLLYGLEPRDPATFGCAVAVLAAVATLAGAVPARRASRIDPMNVLREG